jgi:methyl-accepting chemotaxis protein
MKLEDLSLGKKLAGAVVIFVVPIVILGYFLFLEKNELIKASKQEVAGVEYLQSAHSALAALTPPTPSPDALKKSAAAILDAEKNNGGQFGIADSAQALAKRINGVAEGKDASSVIVRAIGFISDLADKAGLSHDPDIDSYYLGDVLINQTTNILQKTSDMVSAAEDLSHNDQSTDFQIAYAVAREGIQGVGAGFAASLTKAINGNADGSLKNSLEAKGKAVNDSVDKLVVAVNAKNYAEIKTDAGEVIKVVDGFTAKGDSELERILNLRIAGFYSVLMLRLGIAFAAILLGAFISWIIVHSITNPLRLITDLMGKITAGNLNIEVPQKKRRDEIGGLILALQAFYEAAIERDKSRAAEQARLEEEQFRSDKIRKLNEKFNASVRQSLGHLNAAVGQLNDVANDMAQGAESASHQATAVAAAAEQASVNVQTVASASEELSMSIQGIAERIRESTSIAQQAATEAGETQAVVHDLSEATTKISDVVSLINQIAGQTNLLALNATIEAARAGEAGKGFAVVASEVKTLANQTARATEDITEHITAIQGSVQNVTKAIENIGATISKMNQIAGTISEAVQQQDQATREISRNVQEVSVGTTEVTSNIGRISGTISATGKTAQDVLQAAKGLETQTGTMEKDVSAYLAEIQSI